MTRLNAKKIAAEIVRAELRDDWAFADLLRPVLRRANAQRKREMKSAIRATQHWYFELGGNAY